MIKKAILKGIKIILLAFICLWIFTVEIGNVATGSMIPNINVGESVLYWKLYPMNKVEKGDIVVYKPRPDFLVVHRVYEIQYTMDNDKLVRKLRAKGDNNLFVDSTLVDKSNYVGKVFYIIEDPEINAFLKAISNINGLTRAGIILMIMTIWLLVTNHKVQQMKTKQLVTENQTAKEEEGTDKEENTPKEDVKQLDNDSQTKDADWFNL